MAVKGSVEIDRDLCKGCGLCVSVCPEHMLALDEGVINVKGYHPVQVIAGMDDDCIACALCAVMCPDQVITVYKDDAPAAARAAAERTEGRA